MVYCTKCDECEQVIILNEKEQKIMSKSLCFFYNNYCVCGAMLSEENVISVQE